MLCDLIRHYVDYSLRTWVGTFQRLLVIVGQHSDYNGTLWLMNMFLSTATVNGAGLLVMTLLWNGLHQCGFIYAVAMRQGKTKNQCLAYA